MSEEHGLPRGWVEATLAELITLTQNGFGKRSQPNGRPTIVLRLADIRDGEICLADPRRVNAMPEEIQQYGLKPDDLLAIRVNGSPDIVGRVVRFTGATESVLFCDHFIHLRLSESGIAKFLRYFADTRAVRRFVEENKVSSAGQNTVNQSTLTRLTVPVPPLPEQHRIVEKIEELFSDLDAGVASLERAKANLKRYRASVLKSAVEGKLTEDWREEHPQAEDGIASFVNAGRSGRRINSPSSRRRARNRPRTGRASTKSRQHPTRASCPNCQRGGCGRVLRLWPM
jgi:type I restriction enzyme S subunit